MRKVIEVTEAVFGEWVNREYPFKKGHFYQDRPVKGKQVYEIEVEVEFIDDFYFYRIGDMFYGKNICDPNLSMLRSYFKTYKGWSSVEEVR